MIYTEDFFGLGSPFPNDNVVQLVDSYTKENVNFQKTTTWHDGSPMASNLADGIIYRKKGADFYVDIDWLCNRTVYVKRFGALGDGVTNDAPAIRRMIDFLPEKDFIVVFENAKYLQGDGTYDRYKLDAKGFYSGLVDIGTPIFYSFKDKSDFTIYGNGALIMAHPDNAPIANTRGFEFLRCQNFKVINLNYDGSKDTRKPNGGDPSGYNNQSGFKISSSKKYEFVDCRSDNTCMDGFTITSDELFNNPPVNDWNEDGILRNCHSDNSYRQGCSVVNSKRFKIVGGSYTNTGKTYGTSPKDGIDIEEGTMSNFGRGSSDTVVEGVLLENNLGDGLALHYGTHDATVTKCVFKNNHFAVAPDILALSCNNTIYNNNFYDSQIWLGGGGEHFFGNKIYLSPTFDFTLSIDCHYAHYKNNKCRETLVYDNYISRDAGTTPIANGVKGSVIIGNHKDGVKVYNNTFQNLASKDNFFFIFGDQDRQLEFYDNTFRNTDEFVINAPINPSLIYTNIEAFFKKAYNNKIEIEGISPMVSVAERAKGDKLIKSFTVERIPSGKYIDITFDALTSNFDARDLFVQVTTRGYWYDADSTNLKKEIMSVSDVKPISYTGTLDDFKKLPVSTGVYTKNNKSTITFKQSEADAVNNPNYWNLDIVIEVLGKYTDDFPVNISAYYDTNTQPLIINLPIAKSENQSDSIAIDVTSLRNDFNSLLLKLKDSGVMKQ
ncbi:right-handed parallel beta-helix repeat-containing protein [Chryseobacterium sp. RP-3-3]|uniref:Right-handed parallel beta-helix repeat-containing protein n=1 Tax=Chryseobacterium antibioticum TaxID=2728847 RepID=A0A7Y0FRZ3_9FLAO|nr:right-handed parallel beta-helix repeat-containing protein [Chryseobacterium antibioticum]NML70752.1 right-handed parallel beta-helix repeat-containing protein [Chryseobacterium antibioticum]